MDCLDDDSVLAFLDGDVDDSRRAEIERHLTSCAPCADLLASGAGGAPEALAARSLEEALAVDESLVPGATVGRYVILGLVGRGGMGEVYAAYDPHLDRKVALKVLREGTARGAEATAAQERLLREAQAIARLSHPNVVVIYDAGAIDDEARGVRVYLAMEFIDGQTLAAWLAAEPRPWRAIREVFAAAGEGLWAAHEASLVHRDFKPQNVMVARDGTIRVMDFGLASDTAHAASGGGPAAGWTYSSTVPSTRTLARTATGALVGTPLYMAPEQFLGRPTDARTDQFSFCVALYEALYGVRPFPSEDLPALINAVTRGRPHEPPQKGGIPAFLRRIVMRGLTASPASRFPSMRELLLALSADPARRRRALLTGVSVAAAAILAVAGAQRVATRGARLCLGGPAQLAGVWEVESGGPRRAAVHDAFIATGLPYAQDTWTRVSALLDDYSRQWTAAYTDNCEATHVRGDQSPEVLDLRMSCLEGGRRALGALVEVLSHTDRTALAQSVDAVHALPGIEGCSDIPTLRAVVPPPPGPVRAKVAELEAKLARVKALSDTGKWSEEERQIPSLLSEASAVGYQPVLAEALELDGRIRVDLGDISSARKVAWQGLLAALAGRRDDLAASSASILLVTTNVGFGRLDEGKRWSVLADALVRRLGPGHDRIASWFHQDRSFLRDRLGDYQGAVADLEESAALKRRVLPPDHPDIARSLNAMALLHLMHGDGAPALTAVEEGLAIDQKAYGPDNPVLWMDYDDRGEVLELLHRYPEAEHDLRRSIELLTALSGRDHFYLGHPLTALGRTLLAEGRISEAVATLERALRLREHAESNPEFVAETRFALARAYWAAGRARRSALQLATRARDAYLQIPGRKAQASDIEAWLADKRRAP